MNDAPAGLLREAAERWGTPLYVTDLDVAANRARAWQQAMPGALIAYAVKANPDPSLLRRLADDGIGFEVVGPVELVLALRAGVPPEHIVVNGVGQTDTDLREALATGALVNAESLGALDVLLDAGEGRVGLRVNPAIEADTHPHLATGAASSKFGIALADLAGGVERAGARGTPVVSIGAHIGSDIRDVARFADLAALLADVARRHEVGHIDLGGGYAGDPSGYAAAVLPHVLEGVGLIVEPGRGIVADAGWLLTRVVRAQPRGHLIADAGMTELLRPMLYGARHPVLLLTPGRQLPPASRWSLDGPICEAGDLLADDLDVGEEAGEGALLAIGEVGAYGLAMASNYNGRLRPAQAVIEDGAVRLSRRRETLEDLVARDV